mmetsp:Transcript_11253/g.30121  ORF Transcript_11253/g.30121 Transcript_11253/m.30121 type:complete len:263 (+) Transcript_11253:266-1054(+)
MLHCNTRAPPEDASQRNAPSLRQASLQSSARQVVTRHGSISLPLELAHLVRPNRNKARSDERSGRGSSRGHRWSGRRGRRQGLAHSRLRGDAALPLGTELCPQRLLSGCGLRLHHLRPLLRHLVGQPVEGPLRRPQGVAHVLAFQPPCRVGLAVGVLARCGLVVGDDIAPVLGDQVPHELPPLLHRLLSKSIAPGGEHLQRRLRSFLGEERGVLLPLLHQLATLSLHLRSLLPHFRINHFEVQILILIDDIEGPPCHIEAEL